MSLVPTLEIGQKCKMKILIDILNPQSPLPLTSQLKQSESADLSVELDATKEECEQLKHSLTQLKISNDITQNEV